MSTPVLTNHEKYMAGIPLNEELAALKAGDEGQSAESAPVPEPISTGNVRLTRTDRVALKELRQSDGWGALQKLLKITVQKYRDAAILVSEQDPDAKEVVEAWQSIAIVKRLYSEVELAVDAEVKQLDGETKG